MSDIKKIAQPIDDLKNVLGGLHNQISLQASPVTYIHSNDDEYKLYKKGSSLYLYSSKFT